MYNFFINFIPPFFHLWHLPVIFLAGIIAEGYAVVLGGGGILIQFALLFLGIPLPTVIATDIAGCLGSSVGAVSASPKSIWGNKKLIILLGLPFLIGGIIGTIFLTKISATLLSYLLIIALSLLVIHILVSKNKAPRNLEEMRINGKQYPLIGSIMLGLGLYANVSGVGAGTFQKIAYSSLLRMKVVEGIGITNIIYVPTTIFSIIMTALAGLLAWPYVLTLWVGTFIGAHFVTKHVQKIPEEYLRKLLVVLAFLYLCYLVWSLLK